MCVGERIMGNGIMVNPVTDKSCPGTRCTDDSGGCSKSQPSLHRPNSHALLICTCVQQSIAGAPAQFRRITFQFVFPVLVTPGVPTNAHGLRTVLCAPPSLSVPNSVCPAVPEHMPFLLSRPSAFTVHVAAALSCGHRFQAQRALDLWTCAASCWRLCHLCAAGLPWRRLRLDRDCTGPPAGPLSPMRGSTEPDRNPVGASGFQLT